MPFFDAGLPVEYELTRSIRVVSHAQRKKVGILNTDAKLMGDFEQPATGGTAVHHVFDRPLPVLSAGAAEPGLILHALPRRLG